jgi:hypothetical protein
VHAAEPVVDGVRVNGQLLRRARHVEVAGGVRPGRQVVEQTDLLERPAHLARAAAHVHADDGHELVVAGDDERAVGILAGQRLGDQSRALLIPRSASEASAWLSSM